MMFWNIVIPTTVIVFGITIVGYYLGKLFTKGKED